MKLTLLGATGSIGRSTIDVMLRHRIFISSLNDRQSINKGFELGAYDFFTKPFNQIEIAVKISNCLKLKAVERDLNNEIAIREETEKVIRVISEETAGKTGLPFFQRRQVSKDIAAYQKSNGRILPYRGTVQDAGATLTHKVEVVRLLEAGYLEPEICEKLAISHDLSAVENYTQTYKNVMKLTERSFTPLEVAGILNISRRLVDSYVQLIAEHHPEVLAGHPVSQSIAEDLSNNERVICPK